MVINMPEAILIHTGVRAHFSERTPKVRELNNIKRGKRAYRAINKDLAKPRCNTEKATGECCL
jgi:hypothetical protein